jgi:hypothetical protein
MSHRPFVKYYIRLTVEGLLDVVTIRQVALFQALKVRIAYVSIEKSGSIFLYNVFPMRVATPTPPTRLRSDNAQHYNNIFYYAR